MTERRRRDYLFAVGILVMWCIVGEVNAYTQDFKSELQLLSEPQARQVVIERIASRRQELLPLLVEFSKIQPIDGKNQELDVGLAEAFGKLRAPEGLPFLLSHLTLQRGIYQGVLHKNRISIATKYPAMGALIQIGSPSLRAIEQRLSINASGEERALAIIAIGAIGGAEATRLLRELQPRTDSERRLIETELRGIK